MSETAASYLFIIIMLLITIISVYSSIKLKSPYKFIPSIVVLIISIIVFCILIFDSGVILTNEGLGMLYGIIATFSFLISCISLITAGISFISTKKSNKYKS